jgi:hypothetical protein
LTRRSLSAATPQGIRDVQIGMEERAMSAEKYDVVILGGGNAGMGVTEPTRAAGLSVAMIEAWELGGTCPNRGCTPKKVLVAAGHALHEIERASMHGISVGEPRLDWAALIDREKQMISHTPASSAGSWPIAGWRSFATKQALSAQTQFAWEIAALRPVTSSSQLVPSPAACRSRARSI